MRRDSCATLAANGGSETPRFETYELELDDASGQSASEVVLCGDRKKSEGATCEVNDEECAIKGGSGRTLGTKGLTQANVKETLATGECKLVPEEYWRRLTPHEKTASNKIVIMTLNERGLNQDHKVEALEQTLWDLAVDVAVITESHLSRKATKKLILPGYTIEAMDCREDEAQGGVFIAVGSRAHHSEVEDPVKIRKPANACAIHLHPTGAGNLKLRLSGV